MKSMQIIRMLWVGVFLTLGLTLPAQEAVQTGSIVAEVKDQSGAFVPNAHIQVVSAANNISKNVTTDSEGKVSLELSPGRYDLIVESTGFSRAKERIEAKPGTQQTIEIVLKVEYCSACVTITAVRPVSFPGQSEAVSPDGRYAISGVDSGTEPHHTIYLEDRSLKARRKLLDYDRHIMVLWKPDSKLFAVTDYIGSDSSRCSILSVDEKVAAIRVLDVLSRQLAEGTWKQLESRVSNHHTYVEAQVWDGPMSLMVKISGYGDADAGGLAEFVEVLLPAGQP